jgi:hypothetical protein
MALKQDEDFLRFLTMGAAGAAAVIDTLGREHGHRAVELERYATANKLWATKIKRLRLADLFCLDCGVRVEVRTKSALAIRMSHSDAPGREWDAGLRDDDLAAFIAWDPQAETPSAFPQLFEIGAMRSAAVYAKLGPRKSASEGAERDLTWPARVPKRDGRVERVDWQEGTAAYRPDEGRRNTYCLPAGAPVHFYAEEGEALHGGEEFLLGCVAPLDSLACPGSSWDWVADLDSGAESDRYAAVKAAGLLGAGTSSLEGRLIAIAEDPEEDERIRLEARGSLARIDPDQHVEGLVRVARQPTTGKTAAMALAMESIFILSELRCKAAAEALVGIAESSRIDSEARCAATWGLGVTGLDHPGRVLPFIADRDDDVALHALAAIGDVDADGIATLGRMLAGEDREAASAATLLAEDGDAGLRSLLEAATGGDRSALWARAALGGVSKDELLEAASGTLEAEVQVALSPMWISHESWLNAQESEGPLDFLRRQRIRYLP